MSNYDLIIKNGTLVSTSSLEKKDIAIKDGKIVSIEARGGFNDCEAEIYDAANKYVLPGLVEPHMHIKAPLGGITDILDFDTASVCAAYGGVTTFMDFSSTLPGDSLLDAVRDRKKEMEISKLDYSLHCKVVNLVTAEDTAKLMMAEVNYSKSRSPENKMALEKAKEKVDASIEARLKEIPKIIQDEAIPTFKLFMTYRKANVMIDDLYMLKVMKAVKDAGGRCGFHAESNAIAEYNEELFENNERLNWSDFPEYKDNLCEAEAVSRVLFYAEELDAPVYFFHISTKESLELIRQAKKRGVDVIAETCSHYLTFTKEKNVGEDGILYLMSPPLRSEEDRLALWQALKDGTLSLVSSDNCTFTRKMKEEPLHGGPQDFRKPISGVSGIEERFALMMREVNAGHIEMTDLVRLLCENPAKCFGCFPQKGCIQTGSDADFVVVDPDRSFSMDKEALHYPEELEYSVYQGLDTKGCPISTIRRGEFLLKDGVYNHKASSGEFIRRKI